MRRVVYREVGGTRRPSSKKSSSRKAAATAGGTGFGRLLSQLFSASGTLQRSRPRARR